MNGSFFGVLCDAHIVECRITSKPIVQSTRSRPPSQRDELTEKDNPFPHLSMGQTDCHRLSLLRIVSSPIVKYSLCHTRRHSEESVGTTAIFGYGQLTEQFEVILSWSDSRGFVYSAARKEDQVHEAVANLHKQLTDLNLYFVKRLDGESGE